MKRSDKFNNNRPFINNVVEWYSDDFDYDVASVLKIEKINDSYKVIFSKSRDKNNFLTYDVRFRNSRSRYDPYNILFMNMYNELCLYDLEFYQIHMEEYLYKRMLVKNK